MVTNANSTPESLDSLSDTAVRNVVVVLLDSLSRNLLGAYRGQYPSWADEGWGIETPNLDRFAQQSLVFDRHHSGSLPCMPARHDILVGSMDFLWRPWGSIEIWEDAITANLRAVGVTTMLVSDHPHLFEIGGENYHVDFTAWDYVRGHESDPWRTRSDPSWIGAPSLPVEPPSRGHFAYQDSRTWFRSEEDFPGPRTMRAAADWITSSAAAHDRYMLFVDEFDPHEPFDTPEPWASRYRRDVSDPWMIWPPYVVGARATGAVDESQERSLRAAYAAKLSMIDHWFGKVLDAIDRSPTAHETAVVVCTDHGHYLGERDVWGKPGYPIHDALGHLPLLIRWPGQKARRISALSTTVDLHATLCDVFGVAPEHVTHGKSLVPLITQQTDSVRPWSLSGYWGREVQLMTDTHSYTRGSVGSAFPLSMWSNRWSTMPVNGRPELRLPRPDHRAWLDQMPGTKIPVIRQPFQPGDLLPFWAYGGLVNENILYHRGDDPLQERNLVAEVGSSPTSLENDMSELLRDALRSLEAPDDLFERLGL